MKWQACFTGLTYDADDGFVVYFDVESGRTHLLSEIAAWLLAELAVNPLSTEQLRSVLSTEWKASPNRRSRSWWRHCFWNCNPLIW